MSTEWEEGRKKNSRGEGCEREGGREERRGGGGEDTTMGTRVGSVLQTRQLFASSLVLFCFHMAFSLAVWTTNRC